MTEQEAGAPGIATADLPPELPIQFMGREIWVKMPTPEQLLVWKRTLRQLQSAEVEGWNAEQVMIALERTRKIIDSILVNKPDVVWLDDEMLEGNINLIGTSEIINTTVAAFIEAAQAEGNRQARRTATKKTPKKAVRKTPDRKTGSR